MKVLALDTSTVVASVAVMEDNNLLCEYFLNHKKTHSQKIIPMVHEVLENLDLKPENIDLFAAATGPGSFTGLRIGVTSIKAMAYALKKPAIGVISLDALAYNIPICDAIICPILDARNHQVYNALYQWNNGVQERLTDYVGIDVGELIEKLKKIDKNVFILGDGAKVHKEEFKKELKERCLLPPDNLLLQRASSVASIAIKEYEKTDIMEIIDVNFESDNQLVPFYLRKSQAERLYETNKKES